MVMEYIEPKNTSECPFRNLDPYGYGGERLDRDVCNILPGEHPIKRPQACDGLGEGKCPLKAYSVTVDNITVRSK